MRRASLLFACLAGFGAVWPAHAADYQRHHITGGLGAITPQDQIQRAYRTAFAWNFGYGFRPVRYLQIDAGLDGGYNAGNVNDFLNTELGPLQVRDYQLFVPVGGRVVTPLGRNGRWEIYGGGGYVYMRYSERLRQPAQGINIGCPICDARDGNGWYALSGVNYGLDFSNVFKIGVMLRVMQGHTDGAGIGTLPGIRTSDRWIASYLNFTASF